MASQGDRLMDELCDVDADVPQGHLEPAFDIGTTQDEVPMVRLKDGIDLHNLRQEEGTNFEIEEPDEEDIRREAEEQRREYFNPEEVFHAHQTIPGWEEDEEDEDDDRGIFEKMICKMKDLTEEGGVYKKVLREGAGSIVPEGAFVSVHYSGYKEYQDEPFDCTRLRETPHKFKLTRPHEESSDVIIGLDLAVKSMKKGEMSRFILSPDYAFGEHGAGAPRVPPNCTVLFDVELLDFTDKVGAEDFFAMRHEERRACSFALMKKVVDASKKEGNEFFKKKVFYKAMRKYRNAINIIEEHRLRDEQEEKDSKKLLQTLYLNAALTSSRLSKPKDVIHFCNKSLEISRGSAKAHYLKGKALHSLGNFNRSKMELKEAQRLNPTDAMINEELNQLEKDLEKMRLVEKETYQRMFQSSPDAAADSNARGDDQNPIATEKISPGFRNLITEHLRVFLDDKSQIEMPFPSSRFTTTELSWILDIAVDLGVNVKQVGEGHNTHYKFTKIKSKDNILNYDEVDNC